MSENIYECFKRKLCNRNSDFKQQSQNKQIKISVKNSDTGFEISKRESKS